MGSQSDFHYISNLPVEDSGFMKKINVERTKGHGPMSFFTSILFNETINFEIISYLIDFVRAKRVMCCSQTIFREK